MVFRDTHRFMSNGMAAWLTFTHLPVEGGVMDQPAKLMEQLAVIEAIKNEEVREYLKRNDGRRRKGSRNKDIGEEPDGR